MKQLSFLILGLLVFSFLSCEEDLNDDMDNNDPEVERLVMYSEVDSTSITLFFPKGENPEGISWWHVFLAPLGDTLEGQGLKQDLNNDTVRYELNGLIPGSEYEVKVDGRTFAQGGDILATVTDTISTQ